jgi:NDP-sugar pyrophosphorylase family protein
MAVKYPVFLMAGSDVKRKKIMEVLDPEEKYKSKILLPMLGKPIIQWVLDELLKSQFVEKIYVVGLKEEDVELKGDVEFIPIETASNFIVKAKEGLEYLKKKGEVPEKIVFVNADAPGIDVKGIDSFYSQLQKYEKYDVLLSAVEQEIVELAFPDAKKAAKFRDYNLVQGEMQAVSPRIIEEQGDMVKEFSNRRKQRPFTVMLRLVARAPRSWYRILKFMLKVAKVRDAIIGFEIIFKCKADVILVEDPGFGMDMDLPEDYEILKKYVEQTKISSKIIAK